MRSTGVGPAQTLPSPRLLSRLEVPGLVTWHRDIAPDSDDPVLMHSELNLVAFADVQCLPDRIRQGQLRLLTKPRSSVGLRLQFSLGTSLVHGGPQLLGVQFSQPILARNRGFMQVSWIVRTTSDSIALWHPSGVAVRDDVDVASAVAEALAKNGGEVRHEGKAAPSSHVGHGPGPFGGRAVGQHRVGEIRMEGQDV
jgi:hypothetical protein